MTDVTASFQMDLTFGASTAATRDTSASFEMDIVFGGQVVANRNSLTLSVSSLSPLTLFDPFPGSHKFPGSTSYVGDPSPAIGTLTLS